MTREEADKAQDWASLDGGQAFALIERHASDHHEAHEMMEAWKRAHVKAEREACAAICDAEGLEWDSNDVVTDFIMTYAFQHAFTNSPNI